MRPTITERQFHSLTPRTKFTEDGCLVWTGPTNPDGYGTCTWGSVHIVFYKQFNGPDSIPEGKELAHSCHVKVCLIHARPKTHAENIRESHPYIFRTSVPRAPLDWASLLDGEEHSLVRGLDFLPERSLSVLIRQIRQVASRRGMRAIINKVDENTLRVKAYK